MRTRRAAIGGLAALTALTMLTGCASMNPAREALAEKTQLRVPFYADEGDSGGRAALASLLTYWDQPTEPAQLEGEVSRQAAVGRRGSLPADLMIAAENRGLQARSYQANLVEVKAELKLGHPVLAYLDLDRLPWTGDRFVLITGFDDARGGFIVDGQREGRFVPYRTFMSRWEKTGRWAILVMPAGEATIIDISARFP